MAEGGLSIETMSEGFSKEGIDAFITSVEACIETIQGVIKNTEPIVTAIDANWTGKAAENFKNNLNEHVESMSDSIKLALDMVTKEIQNAAIQMSDFDDSLISSR